MKKIFDSPAYKRSRGAYVAQSAFDYFISILVADAFLAKLLTKIGINDDAMIGIISSFVALAFLFQLLAIFVAGKIKNTKKVVLAVDTISQSMFLMLYIIPFTPFSVSVKTGIVIGCILLAYLTRYLIQPILYKWANSYVEPRGRARYSAIKEIISLVGGTLFTLFAGGVIDKYEGAGNIKRGFLFIAILLFIVELFNFISLLMIKGDDVKEQEPEDVPFKDIIKNVFGNRNFVNVIIMTILCNVARYMSVGFLGTFKTNDLLLSVGMVQLINMAGNAMQVIVSVPFGKYSDKKSFASGIKLAYIFMALAFGINMFTTHNTWWFIIIYTVLHSISMAGSSANSYNIIYSYVNGDYYVYASAIKNSIGGIFGFAATLIGSRILSYVQSNGNMLFGFPIYGQQVLCGISFVIMIITIMFVHFVIEKQKVMKQ